eukprot:8244021-Pyramimonas_sp.AAC.2
MHAACVRHEACVMCAPRVTIRACVASHACVHFAPLVSGPERGGLESRDSVRSAAPAALSRRGSGGGLEG